MSISTLTSSLRGDDQPTEEIRLTRRTLRQERPGPSGWSPRTQLLLAGLGLFTGILGLVVAVQVVSAQDLRAEGRLDADELAAALEAARSEVAGLSDAVDAARPAAADARALTEIIGLRADDLSAEAIAAVTSATATLTDLVGTPVTEPELPESIGTPGSLPERYVSAERGELEALRRQVDVQVDRMAALGAAAAARVTELAEARTALTRAVGAAVTAARAQAPATLSAAGEATTDARAAFEQAVAALDALGENPTPDATTRQAFSTYFTAADALRLSHEQAVAAREAAEQAAAEEAARRAEEEARRNEQQGPWWWGWRDNQPGPGDRGGRGRP